MALDHLQCPACSSPVPLGAGDRGTCPACGASYPIPDTYQALRDEATANARKPEALALASALGTPPPAWIRAFAVFSSTAFVALGLGFWVAGGLTVSAVAVPWVGRHLFHVNTYDVLSEGRAMQLMFLVPLGTLVIGFTLSSWARKRAIVRGGLQAALAAKPPPRPGGPKTCHRCAAPLSPEPGSLTARCAYCQADSLVEMPQPWVDAMRTQATKLVKEVDQAGQVWRSERRALIRGLVLRFTLWTVFLLAPFWFIFGAVSVDTPSADLAYAHPHDPPTALPSWQAEVSSRVVDLFTCTEPGHGFEYKPICEVTGRCAIYLLVPLRHGEVVRHHAPGLPAGSLVDLQMNDQRMLSSDWVTVASAPMLPDRDAVTEVRYSGWYRLRVTVPGDDSTPYRYCATVRSSPN